MKIKTEPVGSIPRPKYLVDALKAFAEQQIAESELSTLFDSALKDTIKEIRDIILEAVEIISPEQLGTTDDCGFSPFAMIFLLQEIQHLPK